MANYAQCSYCGVFGWDAALTNCWNIFLSFIGSIPEKILNAAMIFSEIVGT